MSRFYGSLSGSAKTAATRRGNGVSGIDSHTRGWDGGIRVEGFADGDDDVFLVYVTGGSNMASYQKQVGRLRIGPDGSRVWKCAQ